MYQDPEALSRIPPGPQEKKRKKKESTQMNSLLNSRIGPSSTPTSVSHGKSWFLLPCNVHFIISLSSNSAWSSCFFVFLCSIWRLQLDRHTILSCAPQNNKCTGLEREGWDREGGVLTRSPPCCLQEGISFFSPSLFTKRLSLASAVELKQRTHVWVLRSS